MTTQFTTINSIPYPQTGDATQVPTDMHAMATQIDTRLITRYATLTSRDAIVTSPQTGQVVWVDETSHAYLYNGSKWVWLYPKIYNQSRLTQEVEYYDQSAYTDSPFYYFYMEANSVYTFKMYIEIATFVVETCDFKAVAPAGATGMCAVLGAVAGTTDRNNCIINSPVGDPVGFNTARVFTSPTASPTPINVTGTCITGAAAGNFQLQFAAISTDFQLNSGCMIVNKVG
jgi:hypothetical protein